MSAVLGFEFYQGPEVPPPLPIDFTMDPLVVNKRREKWEALIKDQVRYHDAWGILIVKPNFDVLLYDVGSGCEVTRWGGTAYLLLAKEALDEVPAEDESRLAEAIVKIAEVAGAEGVGSLTGPQVLDLADQTCAEVERLRAENAEYVRAHELMVAQFKTMQREKEHGWREAERWEDKAEALRDELARRDEQIAAVRRYAESKAITARARGQEDRPWLDLLIILERAS